MNAGSLFLAIFLIVLSLGGRIPKIGAFSNLSERRQLAVILILVSLIGLAGVSFATSLGKTAPLTADYTAEITINRNLTLTENYVYHVHEVKFRMLFRNWRVPMLIKGLDYYPAIENRPHITLIDAKGDGICYAKDCFGRVVVWEGDLTAKMLAEDLAERNEVGFIRAEKFKVGDYSAKYEFVVFPPIQSDGEYDHINLKLADRHVPYQHVRIVIEDPHDAVVKLYPHIPEFNVHKVGRSWIIEGSAPEDSLVEIEIVLKHNAVKGATVSFAGNVLEMTESENKKYYEKREIVNLAVTTAKALVLAFPLVVIGVYILYGREKKFTVPEFLSYVPRKRKPWLVNLIFKGDAFKFDEDGLYATLLDLQRKGNISIERQDNDLKIRVLNTDTNDKYEKLVLRFLERFSEDGVFDTKKIKKKVERDRLFSHAIASWFNEILIYEDRNIAERFVENKGKVVFKYISAILIFLALVSLLWVAPMLDLFPNAIQIPILMLAAFFQSFICYMTPTQLFGRWKGDHYKEKLEWDAFRRFLSDMAMIKKYKPEDISIWKDWLVYGTALGVGEKVAKAMESLNVRVPEVHTYYGFGTFHSIRTSAMISSSGGWGGVGTGGFGGFGAGGGFGGGGAGGR